MKKLLLILVVTVFSYSAFGQAINWTNGNSTGLWTDQDNWDAGFSPDFAGDEGVFDGSISSADCLITGNQTIGLMTAGVGGGDYEGTITIQSGASLTTIGPRWAAIGWTTKCTLTVEAGGIFSTQSHLWLAFNPGAKSYINIYGTVNVGEMFGVNFEDAGDASEKEAVVTVYNGGLLNLAQLTGAANSPVNSFRGAVADGSLVVLGGGTVQLPGDRTADFADYATAGKIVTPGGNAVITYDVTADLTTFGSDAAPLSTKEFNAFQFEVYPNPSSNEINIRAKSPVSKIKLHNALGQVIMEKNETSKIDISELSAGYYFLRAEDALGNIGTKKIIKN